MVILTSSDLLFSGFEMGIERANLEDVGGNLAYDLDDYVGKLAYGLDKFVGSFWSMVAHFGWVWRLVDGLDEYRKTMRFS
mmetsp:Transcript_23078/g.40480  ORF Transcript_23078/g.40480 Transcript_23078/m.40480 type:complete len:80 (+) Transcript_23078:97-336(+)